MAARSGPRNSLVLAAVVVVVAAGLWADARLLDPPLATTPAEVEVPLSAGSTTCAAASLGEGITLTAASIAAPRPDGQDPVATLRLEDDGEVTGLTEPVTTGGAVTTAVTGGDGDVALTARWDEAPLLLSRRWGIGDNDRVPGTVEAPCPAEASANWVVPGVATAGGAAATLHLANPTESSASLAVTFTTPDGPVAPTRLANLAVPAHGRTTIDLNQFVPEEPDLGVVVTVRAGRVVAEVLQTLEAAVGGVDGRSLVAAESATSETWTIPWVSAGAGESAWVWVTNPGEQATDVRLVLHTADGPVVPPDSGVTLPPGTTRRIDLRGALGEWGAGAVTVRSAPGVPVVASGGVLRVVEDDAVRGGIAIVEALTAGDGLHAALSAVGATGQERVLWVANPGDDDAVAAVSVVGRDPATTAEVATELRVPAGTSVQLPLDESLPLEGGFALLVDVTEGQLAATMVQRSTEGPLDLNAIAVQPFPTTVQVVERAVERDRGLLHPIQRTDLAPAAGGPAPADTQVELDADVEPAPDATPTPATDPPSATDPPPEGGSPSEGGGS